MQNSIERILKNKLNNNKNKVFICIGSSLCVGDSLGPRVGEILSANINLKTVKIIGNNKININNQNINYITKVVNQNFNNPYIILIDSALASKELLGKIIINKNNMIIGKAIENENLVKCDISIKGVVAEKNDNRIFNIKNLYNTSKEIVEKLSYEIAAQILKSLQV